MIIGGSPASTAGGMKTVTFAVMALAVWSTLRRRRNVELFGRSLSAGTIRRAFTLGAMYVTFLAVIVLLLCVAQGPTSRFMEVLFESASACGAVGLSTGLTTHLTLGGKFVIIAGMFVGRVGPLTLLLGLLLGAPGASPRLPQRERRDRLMIGKLRRRLPARGSFGFAPRQKRRGGTHGENPVAGKPPGCQICIPDARLPLSSSV